MKKIISVLLAAAILLALCASLTSCSHECVFSDKWSSDDESHWHECKKLFCKEMADVENHTWGEGTVITPATQEKDGKSSFTCTVCDYTKEENVAYARLLKDYTYHIHVFQMRGRERFPLSAGIDDWKTYLGEFSGNRCVLLEFMYDGRVESLPGEADALREIMG